jgi:hypothetical protein
MLPRASWDIPSENDFLRLMQDSLDNCMSRNIVRTDTWSDQGDLITNFSFHHKPGGPRQASVYVKKYNSMCPMYELGNRLGTVTWQGEDFSYPTLKIEEHRERRRTTLHDLKELLDGYEEGRFSHHELAVACAETMRRITDHPYHRMYLWNGDAVPVGQSVYFRDKRISFRVWTFSSENCVTQPSFQYVFEEYVERSLWLQRHSLVLADGRELAEFSNFRDLYLYARQCNEPRLRAVS